MSREVMQQALLRMAQDGTLNPQGAAPQPAPGQPAQPDEADVQLRACDQSTGREYYIKSGPREAMQAEADAMNAQGRDYFVSPKRAAPQPDHLRDAAEMMQPEQPEQEPVATVIGRLRWDGRFLIDAETKVKVGDKLYTVPPARRQPLTDEEIKVIAVTPSAIPGSYVHAFARAIEAAHGIKEPSMSREVMQMALEALEQLQGGCTDHDDGTVEAITVWCPEVITALREALAQPLFKPLIDQHPKPPAELKAAGEAFDVGFEAGKRMAAQRQPLTDQQLENVFPAIATYHEANKTLYRSIARAIEQAHGIGAKP